MTEAATQARGSRKGDAAENLADESRVNRVRRR